MKTSTRSRPTSSISTACCHQMRHSMPSPWPRSRCRTATCLLAILGRMSKIGPAWIIVERAFCASKQRAHAVNNMSPIQRPRIVRSISVIPVAALLVMVLVSSRGIAADSTTAPSPAAWLLGYRGDHLRQGKCNRVERREVCIKAYSDLTDACNSCHQALNHEVVVIRVPDGTSGSDLKAVNTARR
jgi:hypothetical protein